MFSEIIISAILSSLIELDGRACRIFFCEDVYEQLGKKIKDSDNNYEVTMKCEDGFVTVYEVYSKAPLNNN